MAEWWESFPTQQTQPSNEWDEFALVQPYTPAPTQKSFDSFPIVQAAPAQQEPSFWDKVKTGYNNFVTNPWDSSPTWAKPFALPASIIAGAPDFISGGMDLLSDPFGSREWIDQPQAFKEQRGRELGMLPQLGSPNEDFQMPITETTGQPKIPQAVFQNLQQSPSEVYNKLNPEPSSIAAMQQKEQALLEDPDLFNLPYSLPEDALNRDIISGRSNIEKVADIISLPAQAMKGLMIAEPGAAISSPLDVMGQSIRANIGGKEFSEALAGEVIPEFREDPKAWMEGMASSVGSELVVDPLALFPGAWIEKAFAATTTKLGVMALGKAKNILGKSDAVVDAARLMAKKAFAIGDEGSMIDDIGLEMERLDVTEAKVAEDVIHGKTGASWKVANEYAKKTGLDPSFIHTTIRQGVLNGVPEPNFFKAFDPARGAYDDLRGAITGFIDETATVKPQTSELFQGHFVSKKPLMVNKSDLGMGAEAIIKLFGEETFQVLDNSLATYFTTRKGDPRAIVDMMKSQFGIKNADEIMAQANIIPSENADQALSLVEDAIGFAAAKKLKYDSVMAGSQIAVFDMAKTRLLKPEKYLDDATANMWASIQRAQAGSNQGIQLPKEVVDATLAYGKSIGDDIPHMSDDWVDFMTNMTTEPARKAIKKALRPVFGRWKGFGYEHIQRMVKDIKPQGKFEDIVKSTNELAASGNMTIGGQKVKIDKLFHDDLPTMEMFIRMRRAKREANLNVVKDAILNYGRKKVTGMSNIPEGWIPLEFTKNHNKKFKELQDVAKDVFFQPEVAEHINEFTELTNSGYVYGQWLDIVDQYVRGNWVPATLYPFPSTLLKNLTGNSVNNHLAGIRFHHQLEFGDYTMQIMKGAKNDAKITIDGVEYSTKAMMDEADDMVIRGTGFSSSEGTKQLGRSRKEAAIMKVPGMRTAARTYGLAEDHSRLTHYFYKRIREKMSPMEARASVKKYLFDYQDMTDFEKKLRLFVPFYKFTRANLPLQMEMFLKNPLNKTNVRLSELISIVRDNEAARKVDAFHKEALPDFAERQAGVPIRMGEDGVAEYFILGSWVSSFEVESITTPGGVFDKAYNMLAPYFKVPAEQVFNYDMFLDRNIVKTGDQYQQFHGQEVDRRLVHAARLFRFSNEIDKISRDAYGSGGDQYSDEAISAYKTVMRVLFGGGTVRINMNLGQTKTYKRIAEIAGKMESARSEKEMQKLQEQLEELLYP